MSGTLKGDTKKTHAKMKFQTNSTQLVNALGKVVPVIIGNPTIPILKDVVFNLVGKNLQLTASDMRNTIVTSAEVDGQTDGSITMDGKLLLNILKTLPEGMIQLEHNGKGAVLNTQDGVYEFPVGDPADFPKVPEISVEKSLCISAGVLKGAIEKTLYAAGNEETRPSLCSLLIRLENEKITFVATDSHRLAEYVTFYTTDIEESILIHHKSIAAVKPFLSSGGDVSFSYNKSHAAISIDGTSVYCRLTDERYPDYKAIMPAPSGNNVVIDRSKLLSAVKRLLFLANGNTNCIKFEMVQGGDVSISAEDVDYSRSAHERLDCSYTGVGMSIGFKGKYLSEILSVMDSEEVNLEVTAPNRPALIRPEGEDEYTVLIMPLSV